MATNRTLLCIHRNPAQLNLLRERGFELVTATNGSEGLRLFMSTAVDAVVLEHSLGLLDGSVIASEIKRVQPELPIVMLVDHLELPEDALQSVDALVSGSDGAHFLWATVHFVLNVKPEQRRAGKARAQTAAHLRRPGTSRDDKYRGRELTDLRRATTRQLTSQLMTDEPIADELKTNESEEKDAPFSQRTWQTILNGTLHF